MCRLLFWCTRQKSAMSSLIAVLITSETTILHISGFFWLTYRSVDFSRQSSFAVGVYSEEYKLVTTSRDSRSNYPPALEP